MVESKYNPSQNISFEKSYELKFDRGGYFFYNSMQRLNKRYKVYSARDNKTLEKFISTEAPCVKLCENRYFYLDDEWCFHNGGDSLSCL